MSIQYGQFCPIAKAAEVIGERWTLLLIRELLLGESRFNDLQRGLSQMSPTLLAKRLKQLEEAGLLIKKQSHGKRHAEYFLTASGRELAPVIMGLGEWGARWARGLMDDDELDVELLMNDFRRRIDTDKLPAGRTTIQFHFPSLREFSSWWVVLQENGNRDLCIRHPGHEVDVQIRCDLRTMIEIWAGDTTIPAAKRSGSLKVTGNPVLTRTLSSWLGISLLSHIRPAG
ncbi:winged helix-turn-helix transcriptional regulator [Pelagicoccus enzymogenes]|uniref:winged helix-turn-helix transcriptional regulator n=1 Tax=Pelagicoccus enzymogenes TaxID=2773457 RepID=UPI00280ECAE1|nr:winged helix-turn-helix transcriptional regulator [Pelagicoccus enzymogenes]MDQ8199896.1 winged helix-turn-helix transcriptional regulator [Pelagicoccus enzymogenes]